MHVSMFVLGKTSQVIILLGGFVRHVMFSGFVSYLGNLNIFDAVKCSSCL